MDITDQVILAIHDYADTIGIPETQTAIKALAESMAPAIIESLGLEQVWCSIWESPNGELDEDSDYDTRREVIAEKVEVAAKHAREGESYHLGTRLITPLVFDAPEAVQDEELAALAEAGSE
jgi:hypothetical protein